MPAGKNKMPEPEGAQTGKGVDVKVWEGLFFDFDGVLVDSVGVKGLAFRRLFEQFGLEIADKVLEHHLHHGGMTRFDKFRYYYQEFLKKPLDAATMADLCQRFAALVVDEVVAAPAIPGAVDLLEFCRELLPCFVISATPHDEILEIIRRRGWQGFFREVRGAPASKTASLADLLASYRLPAPSCLVFGDAETDYKAAQACGVPFIGILPGPEAPLLRLAEVAWWHDFVSAKERLFPEKV